MDLATPVERLPRIGPYSAEKLRILGVTRARDLLTHFPFRYEDLRQIVPIAQAKVGATVTVKATVQSVRQGRTWRRRLATIECLLSDDTGSIRAVWYNQPYLADVLRQGGRFLMSGKVVRRDKTLTLQNPAYEPDRDILLHTGRLVPIYPLTEGLTQRQFRFFVSQVLPLARELPDLLPLETRHGTGFLPLADAVRAIHFPDQPDSARRARERLAFDELFLFHLRMLLLREERRKANAVPVPFQETKTRALVASLPFTLTLDQKRAAWEILKDLAKTHPMNRLLEGDVGSGKTVVAGIAMLNVASQGFQSAFLAPTDLLAQQHYATFAKLLPKHGPTVALLTRTTAAWSKKASATRQGILTAVREGSLDVLIGTHALLEGTVAFHDLAFVTIDEQHRFGVDQRRTILAKAAGATVPHLLSMTATPIPRSLALTLFGDLELSLIRELPKGRKPVATSVIPSDRRGEIYATVEREVRQGHQAFVVCPLIEESDALGVKAAESEYARLRKDVFPRLSLDLLHGEQKSEVREATIRHFRAGTIDVLVTTAVIEVGVDIPGATVMVIEDAERFGLAQLHQFRGRVGRSDAQSYCFLVGDRENGPAFERLSMVARTTDGFALADEDLKLRGPGELLGLRQSGFPDFQVARITDLALVRRSRDEAHQLLEADPGLRNHGDLLAAVRRDAQPVHWE